MRFTRSNFMVCLLLLSIASWSLSPAVAGDTAFVVKVKAGKGGTVTPAGTISIAAGETQSFAIEPNEGYHIVSVVVDGSDLGPTENVAAPGDFNPEAKKHALKVKFAINSYQVTAIAGEGGTIKPAVPKLVKHGKTAKYTITPGKGLKITSILVNGEEQLSASRDGAYKLALPITEDTEIVAAFLPDVPPDPDAIDDDGDGFSENQGDCDDSESSRHPDAAEICDDGIDQDCSGADLACPVGSEDVDDDGDGYSENQGDCDDGDPVVNPGIAGSCDGDGGTEDFTAFDAIDAAVAAETITPGQGLLYKMQAIYENDLLPAQFQGLTLPPDGDGLARAATGLFDELPADERAAIEPYLKAPFLVGSWWDLRQQRQSPQSVLTPYALVTDAIVAGWSYLDTANGKARIWYTPGNPVHAAKAGVIRSAVDADIWPKFQALTGREPLTDGTHGGDDRLDIALVKIDSNGVIDVVEQGEDDGSGCGGRATDILIDPDRTDDQVKSTVAHELFHAWQYAYAAEDCDEYNWLTEATATWAKDYVYEKENSEQVYAGDFLLNPHLPLNYGTGDSLYNYGSYLFFQYLTRTYAPLWMKAIWEHAARGNSVADLDAAIKHASGGSSDLTKIWSEFSRYLWNQSPWDKFKQWDEMTLQPNAPDEFVVRLENGTFTKTTEIDVTDSGVRISPDQHLAVSYIPVKFPDDTISSFAFVNGWSFNVEKIDYAEYPWEATRKVLKATPLADEERRKRPVWLYYRVEGGTWQVEELTDKAFAAFCRDRSDGRVREAVVVLGNASLDNDFMTAPGLIGPMLWFDNVGCHEWTGTIELDNIVTEQGGSENYTFAYTWSAFDDTGFVTSPAGEIDFFEGGETLDPKSGYVEWSTWSVGSEHEECIDSGNENWPIDQSTTMDQIVINYSLLEASTERTLDITLGSVSERSKTIYSSGPPDPCGEPSSWTFTDWGFWPQVTADQPEARLSQDGHNINLTVDLNDLGFTLRANLTAHKEWE